MSQIQDYERPFNVVFGEDGGEAKVVPGPEGADFPLWRARRWVVALIESQIDKLPESDEREALDRIRKEFHLAQTGDLVFGMVKRWKNRKGRKRFIGIVEKGKDYKTAGRPPIPKEPKRHLPPLPTYDPTLRTGVPTGRKAKAPKPQPKPSEAERIAGKMAQAARKAVDDDA